MWEKENHNNIDRFTKSKEEKEALEKKQFFFILQG